MDMSGMDMSGMDMGSSSSSSSSSMSMAGMRMDAAQMNMVFFSSTTTPLYSAMWAPTTIGAYAGTCIFLIILGMIQRGLFGAKSIMEQRWLASARKRRYITVADKTPVSEQIKSDADSLTGILTVNGVEEAVRVVERADSVSQPWRFTVDLVRALVLLQVGTGYLLMLAVMTMNVGYFLSVLAGAFIGEVAFGRYGQGH